jgi:hypothetical protein
LWCQQVDTVPIHPRWIINPILRPLPANESGLPINSTSTNSNSKVIIF